MKTFSLILVIALVLVSTVGSVAKVTAYVPTEDDGAYILWSRIVDIGLSICSEQKSAAIESLDVDAMMLWGGQEYDQCKAALGEIDSFDVSPIMKPVKEEYKLYLQDRKTSGYYFEKGARDDNINDIETSISYLEKAAEHLENYADLLEKLTLELTTPTPKPTPKPTQKPTPSATPTPTPELTPTPKVESDSDSDGIPDKYDYAPNDPTVQTKEDTKTPGFGVIFTISSLLAVAYLELRRKR